MLMLREISRCFEAGLLERNVQYQGEDFDNTNGVGKTERPFVGDDDHYNSRINIERQFFTPLSTNRS